MWGVALIFVLNFIFSPPLVAFIHARARWFLANNTFKGFGRGVCSNTSPILSPLTIDWKHSWNERYQAIRDQIRHRAQQSVQLETL